MVKKVLDKQQLQNKEMHLEISQAIGSVHNVVTIISHSGLNVNVVMHQKVILKSFLDNKVVVVVDLEVDVEEIEVEIVAQQVAVEDVVDLTSLLEDLTTNRRHQQIRKSLLIKFNDFF
jgi:hypothetical protein